MVDSRYAKEIDYVFADIVETVKDRALLDSVYQIIELKRGETFMHKGDIWHKFGFLIKGSIYSYLFDDNGSKSIKGFHYFPENYIVVDYESFVKETEVSVYYECYEDSVILLFDGIKFNALFDHIPGLHKTRLRIAESRYFMSLNMIKLLQATNADDKVQEFFNQSPEIFKIFPYAYIASYLGMHRNTYRRAISKLNI
jgi:CRP-like cAMP-binding protein